MFYFLFFLITYHTYELTLSSNHSTLNLIISSICFSGSLVISLFLFLGYENFFVISVIFLIGLALTYLVIKPKTNIDIDKLIAELTK